MARNLKTFQQKAADGPLTEPQLRWIRFNAASNGAGKHGVFVQISRRVYIDVDAFDRWVESQQEGVA